MTTLATADRSPRQLNLADELLRITFAAANVDDLRDMQGGTLLHQRLTDAGRLLATLDGLSAELAALRLRVAQALNDGQGRLDGVSVPLLLALVGEASA
ncbi:hypothetical protein [Pseudomonas oryzihabitans]|uniref:Uncharacterized protein n=1 Tax=Pseudomonas oryzihabitans TaxID=47885 RepID=A0AAJ2BGT7_9PSED|nr:hypothetical protein [Pseudomonas psychrotolerans]MDR6234018.1 hypothetical protein [Pseudomonas psychrotolerans]MDR6356887.1 hypothetical protein [Pseudomonas psychrotolerans]